MQLEEMKNTWQQMSRKIESQERMSNQLIENMTQERFNSRFNKIGYSEYVGAMVCYAAAIYLLTNFQKLETTVMQIFALIAIALLAILPVISLRSLRAIKTVNISSKTYREALNDFVKQKARFLKLQKLNVSLGLFLILTGIPVLSSIQGKELSKTPQFWTLTFPACVIIFLAFAFWVLRSYNKVLNETEKILSDINS